jgi:hypothetical protein
VSRERAAQATSEPLRLLREAIPHLAVASSGPDYDVELWELWGVVEDVCTDLDWFLAMLGPYVAR